LDPKLLYWSLALANMGAVVGLATAGVRAVRRGELARHRRCMTAAAWLVAAFLVSYLAKRSWAGTEHLEVWSLAARINLYVHESFVTTMLIAGATALVLGRRIARTRRVTGRAEDPAPTVAQLRRHRRFGWIAITAAALGLLTAYGILAGMFERAG
jgi:uncharacterized membrane protein YozB (DUF420 family)